MKTTDPSKTAEIEQDTAGLDLGYPRVSASWVSDGAATHVTGKRVIAVRTGVRAGLGYSKVQLEYKEQTTG